MISTPLIQVNKYVYSALAFFLGGFGAHKFYVKKNKNALLYLLFCVKTPSTIPITPGIPVQQNSK
jgi:TM2 domain-containing membrane protein YozV